MSPALSTQFDPSEVSLTIAAEKPVVLQLVDAPTCVPPKQLRVEVNKSGAAFITSHCAGESRDEMALDVAEAFEREKEEITFVHDGVAVFRITTGNIYAPSLTIQLDKRWAVSPPAA